MPISCPDCKYSVLALGGEQKNTFCLTEHSNAFISQHFGDLINSNAFDIYQQEIDDHISLSGIKPQVIASDLHPLYLSTKYAKTHFKDNKHLYIQHHQAHFASVLGEHPSVSSAIGLIFDGTGYGTDGNLWGSEILLGNAAHSTRKASLLPIKLTGGEKAIREPWRIAFYLLEKAFPENDDIFNILQIQKSSVKILRSMANNNIQSPLSSGMGRLFDGISALTGLCRENAYEGQSAVLLEQAATEKLGHGYHLFFKHEENFTVLDWRSMIRDIVDDIQKGRPVSEISSLFHTAIAESCVMICEQIRNECNENTVALSGGCWQNVRLLTETSAALQSFGFSVITNKNIPCNDGGLSYGQAVAALSILNER